MAEVTEVTRIEEKTTVDERPVACGVYRQTIGENGRFVIPKPFIDAFGPSFYMTINEEDNLVLFPEQRFRELAHCLMIKRSQEGKDNDISRAIDRIMYFAAPVRVDTNGRVQVPEALKESLKGVIALPEETVHIVGALDRILLWTEEKFKRHREQHLTREEVIRKQAELLRLIPETIHGSRGAQSAIGGNA